MGQSRLTIPRNTEQDIVFNAIVTPWRHWPQWDKAVQREEHAAGSRCLAGDRASHGLRPATGSCTKRHGTWRQADTLGCPAQVHPLPTLPSVCNAPPTTRHAVVETATLPQARRHLWRRVSTGRQPPAREGVCVVGLTHPIEGRHAPGNPERPRHSRTDHGKSGANSCVAHTPLATSTGDLDQQTLPLYGAGTRAQ